MGSPNKRGGRISVVVSPHYAPFALIFMLVGTANGASLPLVGLFLTQSLGGSLRDVGAYLALSATGVLTTLVMGHLGARGKSRMCLLRVAAVSLAMGWLLMSGATHPWQVFAIGAILFAPLGALSSQVFVLLVHVLDQEPNERQSFITTTLRSVYAGGYVLGPLLGTAISGWAGFKGAFLLTGLLYLAVLGASRRLPLSGAPEASPRRPSMSPFLARSGIYGLAMSCVVLVAFGDDLKGAFLGIHVTENLGASVQSFGVLMAVSAACEVVVLPLVGAAADRWGVRRLVLTGLLIGVGEYALLAISGDLLVLYVVQLVHTIVLAVVLGLGPLFLVRVLTVPRDVASSIFFAGQGASRLAAGGFSAAAVQALGVPHIFFLPAGGVAVALVVCVLVTRDNETAA